STTVTQDRYPTRLVDAEPTPIPRRDPVIWGDHDGPLSADQIGSFDQDGYLSFPRLVSGDEAAELLDEAQRLATDPSRRDDERNVFEPDGDQVRSIFEVHRISER